MESAAIQAGLIAAVLAMAKALTASWEWFRTRGNGGPTRPNGNTPKQCPIRADETLRMQTAQLVELMRESVGVQNRALEHLQELKSDSRELRVRLELLTRARGAP